MSGDITSVRLRAGGSHRRKKCQIDFRNCMRNNFNITKLVWVVDKTICQRISGKSFRDGEENSMEKLSLAASFRFMPRPDDARRCRIFMDASPPSSRNGTKFKTVIESLTQSYLSLIQDPIRFLHFFCLRRFVFCVDFCCSFSWIMKLCLTLPSRAKKEKPRQNKPSFYGNEENVII